MLSLHTLLAHGPDDDVDVGIALGVCNAIA